VSVPSEFGLAFPITDGPAPNADDLSWATAYLRLPSWSPGHNPCNSSTREVSCAEVCRAARALKKWETSPTIGHVWVALGRQRFGDKLSMVYHGLQIAVATRRKLIVDRAQLLPLTLPNSIFHSAADPAGAALPADWSFGCCDVATDAELRLTGAAWPQSLYTHPVIAPFLRANFGWHAAYFMGNFLFGTTESPPRSCFADAGWVMEAWQHSETDDMARADRYHIIAGTCGVAPAQTVLVTNDAKANISSSMYQGVVVVKDDYVCALRKLMFGRVIVQTFGSRLGWWATAMLGRKGLFVNGQEAVCGAMSNSQAGSLWHSYIPFSKDEWVYRINSRFYVCGPNAYDARLYVGYLIA
jgi:hypothetical protein